MGKSVVVIGGGIMGLSCAYYLQKAGHNITVLDQGAMDRGASYVNAGYLTPSHIVSLAAPGMMAKGLRWMFNSSSPFYLKPRWDPDFFKWAWQFHQSATPAKVARAMPIIADINLLSRDLYREIHNSGDLGDFQLDSTGLLMLFKSEKAGNSERAVMQRVVDLGMEARELTADELDLLQPGLTPDLAGAIHYQCDRHTTPTEIMPLLKKHLENSGVRILRDSKVTGFETGTSQIRTVRVGNKTIAADEVVLAAGAWTPLLSRQLGIELSLQAGKGYRIDFPGDKRVKTPAILLESKVAVTPMVGFTRFAGTMELSGINHHIRRNRVAAIAAAAADYYPGLRILPEYQEMAACGLRPVSPDGLPYIGRTRKWENLCMATGHAMMGWSLGPVTGKLISEIISGKAPSMSLDAFRPDRRFN